MKKIIFSALAVSLLLVAGFFIRSKQSNVSNTPDAAAASTINGATKPNFIKSNAPSLAANTAANNSDRNPSLTPEWISSEAHAMNRNFPNAAAADAAQKKLAELAETLSASDREFLVLETVNREQGDNKRALSLYLLTLAPSSTGENFKQIAMMNDPVFSGPLPAHSPEEWQARSVTALAVGALKEIYKRLPSDPSLVREVQEIAQRAPISLVASTAELMLASANAKRVPASAARRKK